MICGTVYACCDEHRRAAVLGNPTLNGIDYLEVLDHDAPSGSPRQRTLLVHCLKPAPANLSPRNILIAGGESITTIRVLWVAPASPAPPQATAAEAAYLATLAAPANVLVIRTDAAGDFSPYELRLVNDATAATGDDLELTETLDGFDPHLACIEFSFKVECGPDFDCKPAAADCVADLPAPPPINYLAKDYGSLRTIVLDRLNQLLPDWVGSSEADIGVMVAELLAYAGDQLSYQQDAVTTEAYIATARSRISLRRHARLVDYFVHDGCNARAWTCLEVNAPVVLKRGEARFFTDTASPTGRPISLDFGVGNEEAALLAGIVVFEPMQDAPLWPEHNQMKSYAWGNGNCCLPRGAIEATLLGTFPNLQVGDVLVFQEVLGPQTGNAADADLRHRCAVRLTRVATRDASGRTLVDPLFEAGTGLPITSTAQLPTPVTEIRWSDEDALPFAVCLSASYLDSNGAVKTLVDVSIVLGNVVLADQGLSMPDVPLAVVPQPTLVRAPVQADRCDPSPPLYFAVRYRPELTDGPVTQAQTLPLVGAPVTPGPVRLVANSSISLADSNGNVGLMVTPKETTSWPSLFGVLAAADTADPANFDLSIVFDPPGGPAGVAGPPVLELLANLTVAPGLVNSAPLVVNASSRFIRVPASYVPPAANPATFPAAPTMLPNAGAFSLDDGASTPYLDLEVVNPLSWPAQFGVFVEGHLNDPDTFNLLVLYNPGTGSVGFPRVVEQFNNLTLALIAQSGGVASALITVQSFEGMPPVGLSASALVQTDASTALPQITLTTGTGPAAQTWTPAADLLASGEEDEKFVVEVESDGSAKLRFGDGVNGRMPDAGTIFAARYRIGNGTAGNVGAASLVQLVADPRIVSATNPLPAAGGVDPETSEQIRRRAPQAFMTQERAINMPDYVRVAESNAQIEDAAAALRWTGSWYTVFIAAEPKSGGDLAPALRETLTRTVNRYRLAGEDIQLEGPDYVPLDIELSVCVDPTAFQADVRAALSAVLGSGCLPGGVPALFAPGRFQLGQTVYLSPIYAAARSVAGVLTVRATVFQPQGFKTLVPLQRGEIPMGPFQVARMDNDPSLPDHGQLRLVMFGGK